MIIFLDILKTDSVRPAGEVLKTMRIHKMPKIDDSGAPNENIVQNHLNIALVNVF